MSTRDHEIAQRVADAAGARLLEIRGALIDGADVGEVRGAGDRVAHELILDLLATACPGDAVLSEEAPDDDSRLGAERLWIVDPLDGTREFGELGRDDWAVHVALVVGGRLAAGAVALPAAGRTYTTRHAEMSASPTRRAPRIAVSRTRPAPVAVGLMEMLEGELVPMGSAGAKGMAVVSGAVDVYVHSGGQYVWDSAAPVAVAAAAGAHVSRIDGSPLIYGGPDIWLPDVLICRRELAARVVGALTRVTSAQPTAPL